MQPVVCQKQVTLIETFIPTLILRLLVKIFRDRESHATKKAKESPVLSRTSVIRKEEAKSGVKETASGSIADGAEITLSPGSRKMSVSPSDRRASRRGTLPKALSLDTDDPPGPSSVVSQHEPPALR